MITTDNVSPQKSISNPSARTNLIIVMGVAGSGKSTIAQALANHYHFQYLDGDDFHSVEARAQMAKGIPLTDAQRAPWVANIHLRLQENAKHQLHTCLAFSGLRHKHRDQLRSAGLRTLFLFLQGDKNIIQQRLDQRTHHFMAPQLLSSQFSSLEDPLSESDVYPVDISTSPEQVINHAKMIIDEYFFQTMN